VTSTNPLKVGLGIIRTEGVANLYKGWTSAMFRQATYTTARIGIYRFLYNHRMQEKGEVPFLEKASISLFAGFISALIGNPSDLALVRFQADFTLPPEHRRNYRHVFDAFGRIVKEEGVGKLWRGSSPTIVRAMSINLGQMVSYDEFKGRVFAWRGVWDLQSRIYTAALAGCVCAIVSLPADNLKTKLQKMKMVDGKLPYKNLRDCFVKSVRREGFFGLWIGLPTFVSRVVPNSTSVLMCMDFLNTHFGGDINQSK
jgi:solute carrier family 25 oxoglutarate transporter 11